MEDAAPASATRRALLAAVACLAVGCSSFQGTTAGSFLRTIREDRDPNRRYHAYSKLGSPNVYDSDEQKDKAVAALVAKLQGAEEPIATRAVICRTLGELRRPSARDAIVQATSDNEELVRREAHRALGKVGRPEDATVLARTMTVDTSMDCRIAAIEALGQLRPDDPRIHLMLVGALEHDDPAIRYASLQALRSVTGKDRGVDVAAWRDLVQPETVAQAPEAVAAPVAGPASPAVVPVPVPATAPPEPASAAPEPFVLPPDFP